MICNFEIKKEGILLENLRKTLVNAKKSTFYKEKLAEFNDEDLNCASFEFLTQLPFTNKEDLRAAGLDILAVPLKDTIRYYETSGTTGTPTPTPKTKHDIVENTKGLLINWTKILKGKKDIALLMLPSDLAPVTDAMVYALEAMDVLSIRAYPFTLGICDWDRIIKVQSSTKSNLIITTPGLILFFYNVLKTKGLNPKKLGVDKIFVLGELVTEPMRKMIENLWEADVFVSSYGTSELGTFATSCSNKKLHLLTDMFYFELIDPITHELTNKNEGELVVTSLVAEARPLIRYCTGDYVKIHHETCDCKLEYPVVEVVGRIDDFIEVNGNRITHFEIEQCIYSIEGINGYSIDLDKNQILLEIEFDFRNDENISKLIRETKKRLADSIIDLEPIVKDELNQMTKLGGGIKNWKITHVVKK